jgi:hypothetical protein
VLRARQLETLLAERAGRTVAELDLRGRELRAAGLVLSRGPGRNAPVINAKQAFAILIAAAISRGTRGRTGDTAKMVKRFQSLHLLPGGLQERKFADADRFGDALTRALDDRTLADRIEEVVLSIPSEGNLAVAKIFWGEGGENICTYVTDEALKQAERSNPAVKTQRNMIRDAAIIDGGLVHVIATSLKPIGLTARVPRDRKI